MDIEEADDLFWGGGAFNRHPLSVHNALQHMFTKKRVPK